MPGTSARGLPAQLEAALAQLRKALLKGRMPGAATLAEVVEELGTLPPDAATRMEAMIAFLGGLHRPPDRTPSLLDLIRPARPTLDLLKQEPGLAPVFLLHRDGHVREAALDSHGDAPGSPFFLALLATRLNDWALPVRAAARRRAERLFPRVAPEVVVGAAPFLLDRWRHWSRWEPAGAALLDTLLKREDVAVALAERFRQGATGPLATELRHALRVASIDPHLPALARDATQPAVRAVALRTLIRGVATWPTGFGREWIDKSLGRSRRVTLFAERKLGHEAAQPPLALIAEGLSDRSALVRRVAADALIEYRRSFPALDDAIALLERDRSPALRQRGAFLARKRAEEARSPRSP